MPNYPAMQKMADAVLAEMSLAEKRYTLAGNREPAEWLATRVLDVTPTQAERVADAVLLTLREQLDESPTVGDYFAARFPNDDWAEWFDGAESLPIHDLLCDSNVGAMCKQSLENAADFVDALADVSDWQIADVKQTMLSAWLEQCHVWLYG